MRKLALGIGALALMASAAFAQDEEDNTRVAAVDSTTAAFTKLDADTDGRVSAIEAANNSKVAAGFTTADADKDGYLSKPEFGAMMNSANDRGTRPRARPARHCLQNRQRHRTRRRRCRHREVSDRLS